MLYTHQEQDVRVYALVYVRAHLCHADAEARDGEWRREWRREELQCSEPMFTRVRPLSQAHPHGALFVHFARLEKSDEEPWHVGKSQWFAKALRGWSAFFNPLLKCARSPECILFCVLQIEIKINEQLKGACWQIYIIYGLL